jgi:hypothetical protein
MFVGSHEELVLGHGWSGGDVLSECVLGEDGQFLRAGVDHGNRS